MRTSIDLLNLNVDTFYFAANLFYSIAPLKKVKWIQEARKTGETRGVGESSHAAEG
jgi:hypothetical protein